MKTSYAQLLKQIGGLQVQAEAARRSELRGVVARIKEAIAAYGITAADIGFVNGAGKSGPATGHASAGKRKARTRYADGQGGSWGGMGKRPQWLRDALASGRSLEEFAVREPGQAKPGLKSSGRRKSLKSKSTPGKALYRDAAGNRWSGRGPRPRWLKAALDAGKSLEDLKA